MPEEKADDRRRVWPEKDDNGEERDWFSSRIEQCEEIDAIFDLVGNCREQTTTVLLSFYSPVGFIYKPGLVQIFVS